MKGIVVFDIGKTNKKVLLFNEALQVVEQQEQKMNTITDDEGFECDDLASIEQWVIESLKNYLSRPSLEVVAVNFSTYGASLVFLDEKGRPLTPLYNYLKPVEEHIAHRLFEKYGGEEEFCRQTASPSLGLLLNSGIQILWMKETRRELFDRTASILHFPQYLSFLFTNKVLAESTSIGCHTYMWNFDQNSYHRWLADEEIDLPAPVSNTRLVEAEVDGKHLKVGVGIHDSSASLVPYLMGSDEQFVLLSTGTWCISMNPYNDEVLTADELRNDCLNYINIYQKPVKSARYFMGHIHDVNVERINTHFGAADDDYKKVLLSKSLLEQQMKSGRKVFFKKGTPEGYLDEAADLNLFADFNEAYHQLMFDLSDETIHSLQLVVPKHDNVSALIVSGGFARNPIFMQYLAARFPDKKVYTSEIDNASALGAAMVCAEDALGLSNLKPDLGLQRWEV
ncbi:FGGY-family carbohydrate kinase [Roseimarinus sediminis]|uniref:FGGY-family carbohydrate kinase n=1 Tax=Roseimarinus sediminis TaxID=1610899 RepID=UPI003D1E0BED